MRLRCLSARRRSVALDDAAEPRGEPQAAPAPAPATRDDELAAAEAEARYREERVSLYRAKMYGPRPTSPQHLRELERARDGAAAKLRRVRERRGPTGRGDVPGGSE